VKGTVEDLRYSPHGTLAALVIQGAEKEVGATQAGAPIAGELGADIHEQRIAIIHPDGTLAFASPPDLFVYEYDWRPDESGFVGTAAHGDGDNNWWVAKLYAFDAKSAAAKIIYSPANARQQLADPRVAPDGATASFIGGIMSDFGSTGGDAFLLPLDKPNAKPVDLTPKLPATVTALAWSCDGKTLLASELAAGDRNFVTLSPAAKPAILASTPESVSAGDDPVSQSCATGTAAAIHQSFTKPPEIEVGHIGAWHDLTQANLGLTAPAVASSVVWKNEGFSVQGWLLLPVTSALGTKLPLITDVHGGPGAASQPHFAGSGLAKAMLDAGYALFLPNPRGSFGQGEAFVQANRKDFGYGDLRDILKGMDVLEAKFPIDKKREGLTGWSYGGFMSMFAATQTNRFAAIVAGAGLSDWLSYYGENSIDQWMIPFFGASVYDDPAVYAKSSAITFIKKAAEYKTPMLIIVGDRDGECPAPQSFEMWHALKDLGVKTQLVVYPNEGHGFRNPAHIRDRTERTAKWFAENMPAK